jgi:glycogen operon protein
MKVGWSTVSAREIATRMAGSSDIFQIDPTEMIRGPFSSINYITAHDGFTLRDLVTYNQKHNEANKEDNRDGTTDNNSFNHGCEGETDNRRVNAERRRTMRNLLSMLLFSSGIPMIVAGDEFGRTQDGNNNAYCQDSEISYLDWNLERWQHDLLTTTKHLLKIRSSYPALRQISYFTGKPRDYDPHIKDISWFSASGEEFTSDTWQNAHHRVCQCLFGAQTINEEDVLIVINGSTKKATVSLPSLRKFQRVWNSHNNLPRANEVVDEVKLEPFSVQVFTSVKKGQ